MGMKCIGVDIGGTSVKIGLLRQQENYWTNGR